MFYGLYIRSGLQEDFRLKVIVETSKQTYKCLCFLSAVITCMEDLLVGDIITLGQSGCSSEQLVLWHSLFLSLVTGAYRSGQLDHSFCSEPGLPEGGQRGPTPIFNTALLCLAVRCARLRSCGRTYHFLKLNPPKGGPLPPS